MNRLSHESNRSSCADVDSRVTNDIRQVTTAIDIADGTNISLLMGRVFIRYAACSVAGRKILVFSNCLGMDGIIIGMTALCHIDVDTRVADHQGTVATAIDGTDTGKGTHIDLRVIIGLVLWLGLILVRQCVKPSVIFVFCPGITATVIAIDRVAGQVAAAIQFTDDDGHITIARLLDVHSDGAFQFTAVLVAAEHLAELAAGDGQADIACHIGSLSTGIDLTGPAVGHTA